MAPEYKVGDKVLIKRQYDPNCSGFSYPCYFGRRMMSLFGGKLCTVKSIQKRYSSLQKTLPCDGYVYKLKEDPYNYNWTTPMFDNIDPPTIF